MKTEHTRNWEYREGTTPHYQGQIYDEKGKTVAISYDDEGGHIARLAAAVPELLDVVEKVVLHLNGLNATMRACSREYAASPVCRAINEIVRDAAKAYHKATKAEGR